MAWEYIYIKIEVKRSKMITVFKKAFNWYCKVYYEVYKPMIDAGY